jgi:hypothetical protein
VYDAGAADWPCELKLDLNPGLELLAGGRAGRFVPGGGGCDMMNNPVISFDFVWDSRSCGGEKNVPLSSLELKVLAVKQLVSGKCF